MVVFPSAAANPVGVAGTTPSTIKVLFAPREFVAPGDGKVNVNAAVDYNLLVGGNYTSNILGSKTEYIAGSKSSQTTGTVVHRGATIDLN